MKKIYSLLSLVAIGFTVKAQDTCITAIPITAGSHVVSAVNGTQVPTPICAANGTGATAGEWYSYTPTQTYTVTVSSNIAANNPKIDTRFHVYSGTCGTLTCVGGDDDSGANYSSVGSFTANAGATYYIAWDNRWSSLGFTFQLTEGTYTPPPPTPISYTNQTVSTINSTYNICVVDMNGDFKDDIVGVSANNLRIHHQGLAGVLTATDYPITGTSDMPTWSLAAGDYNKDGYNDLVLGSGSGLTFWRSNATGTAYTNINPSDYIFCQRTNFVDINNDGHLDAFSCHDVAPNVYYLNTGTNNFTHYQSGVTAGAYNLGTLSNGGNYASIWTDYDNDGDSDMFISKCSGPPCELHRNDGNGIFTDISAIAQINTTPVQSWSSAVADFDNDGDMDILVGANGGSGHMYFKNNLDKTNSVEEPFTNITVGSGWDTDTTINRDYIAYDFDNNGFIDVMGGGNRIMFNQGNGTFAASTYTFGVGSVGDLNNDGFLDIANGSTIRYAIPNANNWVKVTLQGVQSNRNGIGARVEIYGAWGKQIRDVRSGEGFEYMSTLNAHFGIGTATAITQVKVIWPSGTVDVINNPNPNQILHIIEGSSPLSLAEFGEDQIRLYPNPTSNVLSIVNVDKLNIENITIIDSTGKIVKKITHNFAEINVSNLSEGIYILSIQTKEGKKFAENFIKK